MVPPPPFPRPKAPQGRDLPPWVRLGISAPLFLFFIILIGVLFGTLTWGVQQLTHRNTPNNTLSYTQITTGNSTQPHSTHRIHTRSTPSNDQECTPGQVRSTTLCIPSNISTSALILWDTLGGSHLSAKKGTSAGSYRGWDWYMTVGAQHGDWTWDNLVAETGYDWSSYTSTGLGTQWRPRLTLATEHTGLKVGIRPVSSTGCQDFRLAPYVSCTATPVYWKIQVCVVTNSTAHSITVGINLTSPIFDSVTILTAPSTPDGEILTATGISGFGNNWLLLAEEAGKTTNRSCVVCMGPRPLLRIVPVVIPAACVLPVMKHDNPHPNCSSWDKVFPLVKASRREPLVFFNGCKSRIYVCKYVPRPT